MWHDVHDRSPQRREAEKGRGGGQTPNGETPQNPQETNLKGSRDRSAGTTRTEAE